MKYTGIALLCLNFRSSSSDAALSLERDVVPLDFCAVSAAGLLTDYSPFCTIGFWTLAVTFFTIDPFALQWIFPMK